MTKNEEYIVDMYVRYFGRAADAATIATYAEDKKTSVILKNIIADADAEKAGLSTSEFVDNAFQNLFGRKANTKEMNKYSKVVDAGKDLPINSIVKSAAKTDKKVYDNKKAVALKYAELGGTEQLDLSKISKDNIIELNFLNTVTKAADLKAKVYDLPGNSGVPSAFDGKTFTLTEGVDTVKDFTGTNKGDLFVADNSGFTATASAADTLDGGKGVDTFKVYDDAAGAGTSNIKSLPTLKNIENVVIYDNQNAALGLTKWDTVETLFLVGSVATTGAGNGITLGEKVTTVNFEDIAANAQVVKFNNALTAATVGVNKVGAAAAPVSVTVDGAALKTLTINASGKASEVNLDQTAATIETLNITGRADLALDFATPAGSKIVTIDGSKAQGKLDLDLANTTAATLKTVKTGTGDDKLTVTIAVASGTTIDLGAGNDKLVAGTGTIAAGSIIDGGAGIDSLDSDLVNVGNAGVFANFETISLNAATVTPLDLDLLTKSTITSIAKDAGNDHALINVKKSQALTVNAAAAGKTTTLTFKASEVAGTADAYTINFNADNATPAFDAGTVSVEGIETVTVNSVGKTGATNLITLEDKAAKSLVITGDKELTVAFGANGFGSSTAADATNGLGVSTIDASASTAGITIAATELVKVNSAWSGLTIKGGAGDDDITTGAITKAKITALTIDSGAGNDNLDLGLIAVAGGLTKADIKVNAGAGNDTIKVGFVGGTFTLGAGKDTIDVINATVAATTTVAAGAIKTTITDIEKGDVIQGLSGNLFVKADISGATDLDSALGKASIAAYNSNTTWFQYAGKTYIVDNNSTATIETTDIVVELNGTVNLGSSEFNATANTLTIA